jgi:hypothetical protein
LDVNGNAKVSGNITVTAYYYNSDKRYKSNITALKSALDKIVSLNGYHYFNKLSGRNDIGVIAQEIEQVFPDLVHTDEAGYKSVEYGNLVAPLIEAVKELNAKVDAQAAQINALEARLNALEARLNALEAK